MSTHVPLKLYPISLNPFLERPHWFWLRFKKCISRPEGVRPARCDMESAISLLIENLCEA